MCSAVSPASGIEWNSVLPITDGTRMTSRSEKHMVVTLAVPPAKVRELNRSIESGSYTTFKSEVYLGYDFWPVVQAIKARRAEE